MQTEEEAPDYPQEWGGDEGEGYEEEEEYGDTPDYREQPQSYASEWHPTGGDEITEEGIDNLHAELEDLFLPPVL